MAKIIITTDEDKVYEVNGRMTFEVEKVTNEKGELVLQTSGKMTTHNYIEGIVSIETDRYKLEDVEIIKETFGSNDFDILYEFVLLNAYSFEVKGGESNLTKEKRYVIEKEEYKNDEADTWSERRI